MQHVDYVCAVYARRIVNARVLESGYVAQLLRALISQKLHVFLRAEMQAARRTRFDTRRFESRAHAVHAQSAFENFARSRTEFWNVERAARHAIAAADAMLLLEIDDSVHILNDRAVGRACRETSRILAM